MQIKIKQKIYHAHRIIYFYVHGYWPTMVDHIDCNKLNNSIENLREVTNTLNQWNTKKCRGCCFDARAKKWRADIRCGGKRKFLGHFNSENDARIAYLEATLSRSSEFCRNDILNELHKLKKNENINSNTE